VNQTFAGLTATPLDTSFFSELYEEFTDPATWRVYEDVRPCLDRLLGSGIKLGVISNWDERLRPLLRALDLDRYFHTIVVSAEAGFHKPGPEIFRAAAKQLLTPPQAILHIGDSRSEDYEGARAAGFQSLLLKRVPAAEKNGAIASLDELAIRLAENKSPSGTVQAGP
jgi:putative hydrolase of the HAD superfamily